MTTEIFRTLTTGNRKMDLAVRLKLDTSTSKIFLSGVEVQAKVDMETGEVKFFVQPEDLQKLKDAKRQ